ncbi:MAG: DJ-1/PfpI family protein [Candidatus Thorarchaeota archaeon]
MRKYITLFVLGFLVASSILYAGTNLASSQETDDIDILVLISDECGWNYFVVNETLVEMGVTVTTMSNTETYSVTSCPSKDPRPITADILLSEFDLESITEYDGIVIPSGGQWQYIANDTTVHNLLNVAYDNGLLIGTICNGGLALGHAELVTNGTKIVCPFPAVYYKLDDRGAIIVWDARVVSDNNIVTGSYGVPPDGYETAPTYEVCLEMVKKIGGLSYAANIEVTSDFSSSGSNCSITVEIEDFSESLPGFNISDIRQIVAYIYPESDQSNVTDLELDLVEETGEYTGNFTITDTGRYIVDLEIKNEELSYEIFRNATIFNVEEPIEGIPLNVPLVVGGVSVVVAVLVVVLWRRKTPLG